MGKSKKWLKKHESISFRWGHWKKGKNVGGWMVECGDLEI